MIVELEVDPAIGELLLDANDVEWEVVSLRTDRTFKVRKKGDETPLNDLPNIPLDTKRFRPRGLIGNIDDVGFFRRCVYVDGKQQVLVFRYAGHVKAIEDLQKMETTRY